MSNAAICISVYLLRKFKESYDENDVAFASCIHMHGKHIQANREPIVSIAEIFHDKYRAENTLVCAATQTNVIDSIKTKEELVQTKAALKKAIRRLGDVVVPSDDEDSKMLYLPHKEERFIDAVEETKQFDHQFAKQYAFNTNDSVQCTTLLNKILYTI